MGGPDESVGTDGSAVGLVEIDQTEAVVSKEEVIKAEGVKVWIVRLTYNESSALGGLLPRVIEQTQNGTEGEDGVPSCSEVLKARGVEVEALVPLLRFGDQAELERGDLLVVDVVGRVESSGCQLCGVHEI